jgi:hypothetical protein
MPGLRACQVGLPRPSFEGHSVATRLHPSCVRPVNCHLCGHPATHRTCKRRGYGRRSDRLDLTMPYWSSAPPGRCHRCRRRGGVAGKGERSCGGWWVRSCGRCTRMCAAGVDRGYGLVPFPSLGRESPESVKNPRDQQNIPLEKSSRERAESLLYLSTIEHSQSPRSEGACNARARGRGCRALGYAEPKHPYLISCSGQPSERFTGRD